MDRDFQSNQKQLMDKVFFVHSMLAYNKALSLQSINLLPLKNLLTYFYRINLKNQHAI